LLVVFSAFILLGTQDSVGKCLEKPTYYCVAAVFEKALPDKNPGGMYLGEHYCSGLIALGDKSIRAILPDQSGACPAHGAQMVGHLEPLCQDTGQWTEADYSYSAHPEFCDRTEKDGLHKATVSAGKIRPGITREKVQELLKDFILLGRWGSGQYYLHPDIILDVPFDVSGGRYRREDRVKGSVTVKRTKLPQP
jgi:hypothetical protein